MNFALRGAFNIPAGKSDFFSLQLVCSCCFSVYSLTEIGTCVTASVWKESSACSQQKALLNLINAAGPLECFLAYRAETCRLAAGGAVTHHKRAAVVFYFRPALYCVAQRAFTARQKTLLAKRTLSQPVIIVARGNLMRVCVFASHWSACDSLSSRLSPSNSPSPSDCSWHLLLRWNRPERVRPNAALWLIGIMWTDTSVRAQHGD